MSPMNYDYSPSSQLPADLVLVNALQSPPPLVEDMILQSMTLVLVEKRWLSTQT